MDDPLRGYYPPTGYHFSVSFGFLPAGNDMRFQEVGGLTQDLDVEEFPEGGENRFVHRLPKRSKYQNLVLKRGVLVNSMLISWLQYAFQNMEVAPGIAEPTTVTVILLNEKHLPAGLAYSFIRTWPVKWSVSDFNAQQNTVVVETLELTYNYFVKIPSVGM